MDHLAGFLDRFKRLAPPDAAVRNGFVRVVHELLGIDVVIDDVHVVRNTIVLSVPNIHKSEIFMHRATILENLRREVGEKAPIDIR